MPKLIESCDVVIVGSGAGGAVLAKELAEGGQRVIIVEEGDRFSVSSHTDLPHAAISRLYRDRGFTTSFGHPFIPIPLGKALGGTTVINSGTCFRTPDRVLNHWQQELELSELKTDEFKLFFERIEKELHIEDADFKVMSQSNLLFHEALLKKGMKGHPLKRNIKNCEGCGFCCYGCPSGAKQSMDVSYLPKAFAAGAKAITRCKVEKILFEGKRTVGVLGRMKDESGKPTSEILQVNAEKVVIAAGAIQTPVLLKKNKIARWNQNLGRNLTLHPATKLFAEFDEDILGWEGTPQAYYLDQFEESGITFEGVFMPPDVAAMTVPFVGQKLSQFMLNYRKMATFGFLIGDSNFGRVTHLPGIGTTVFYHLQKADVERIRKGVLFLSRLFLESGAKKVVTLIHGYSEISTPDDLTRLENGKIRPKDIECMAFHPLGSCKMGKNSQTGVVGQNHEVFGYEGLVVCDGSVVPSSLGVNPQVTIMALATRLAYLMLNKKVI